MLAFYKFRDTSIIAHIYTSHFGRQSFIVKGIRSAKANNKMALFQPLSLLEMEIYHKDGQEIHQIKEYKTSVVYQSIPFNQNKSAVTIFLAEILTKTLKDTHSNEYLLQFLFDSFTEFDLKKTDYQNFHLYFLMNLSAFLGYSVSNAKEFAVELPVNLTSREFEILDKLINNENIVIQNLERRVVLEKIMIWYKTHFDGLGKINSLEVLQEVFDV